MKQLVCGIDFGGTSIRAAVANEAGKILGQSQVSTPTQGGPNAVIEQIAACAKNVIERSDDPVSRIGIGAPGLVDIASGTTKFLPNLETQWVDVPLGARLSEQLNCPVRVLNDARAATLGELRFGHGRSQPNLTMAFFSVGTGIGGGIAIDGQLRLGPLGAAGELGHQTIVADGPRCSCGNRGCLEALSSGPAIAAAGATLVSGELAPALSQLVDGDPGRVTPGLMGQVADSEPEVAQAIEQAATNIGIAAANVVTILHPQLIVIGGGVGQLGDLILDPIRAEIEKRVNMFPPYDVRVESSMLEDQAGLYGAIALALEPEPWPAYPLS